jgi:peptidoglycan/LPS O-acetylase OafA/YrhL
MSLANRESPSGYIPTLDGWRAVAILLVMISHALHSYARDLPAESWLDHVSTGTHGVNLFFGISGLLITSRLVDEWNRHGRISLRGFYVRRVFRILPAALLVLVCVGALGVAGLLPVARSELVASLFFYRNYLPALLAPDGTGFFTAHYWSLAVEEHFYLVWPLLLLVAGVRRGLWVAITLAIGVAYWRHVELWREIAQLHAVQPLYFVRTDLRVDSIMWGAVAALLLARSGARATLERHFSGLVWLAVAALYAAVVYRYGTRPTFWEAMLVPLLLVGTVVRPTGLAGRVLEWPALRLIGRLSYSLYLWELFFVYRGVDRTLGVLQLFPINVIAAVMCAAASYYLLERPLVRLGHRLAPSVPGAPEVDSPAGPGMDARAAIASA